MAGKKPLPTKIKLFRGENRTERLNPNEPQPRAIIPRVPAYLNDVAKKEWRHTVKKLHQLGIFTEIDERALATYCQAFSLSLKAAEVLEEKGLTTMSRGSEVQRPEVAILNKCQLMMHRFLIEFGMTPSSRTKLEVKTPKKGNFSEFLDN